MCLNFSGNLIIERFLMDKFPWTKFEKKYEQKKIEKCQQKKVKKKSLELINYFYMFFQTYLTYFSLLFKD